MDLPEHSLFIDSKWVPSISRSTGEVLDPATNRPIARVAAAVAEDVDAAVDSARRAFESTEWREMDPSKRGRLLWLLGQEVRSRFDELAHLESLNVGKPIREAKGDIAYVYKLFEYYAGLADKIQGDTIPLPGSRLGYTLHEPLGITAHIAPWNYPLLLACRGIAPALAAGNTVVLKPATLTPLTALKLAELTTKVGFPTGVFNVVTGPGRTVGNCLASHSDVDSITFTGSTETGRQIMQFASKNVTPVTLELGGKNPNIVFQDAKIDRALRGVMLGIFQNAGQMCWAGSRLFVHESIHEDFMRKLVETTSKIRLGPGSEEATQMGPLVSREQERSVIERMGEGARGGATVLIGGHKADSEILRPGNFVEPTIFDDVAVNSPIAREEIFGPVLCAFAFHDEDEVIAAANDTEYGLAAGIWTQSLTTAHRVAARLEAGMVAINEFPITFPQMPFSGFKQSALGHEQGIDAVDLYTRIKSVTVNVE